MKDSDAELIDKYKPCEYVYYEDNQLNNIQYTQMLKERRGYV